MRSYGHTLEELGQFLAHCCLVVGEPLLEAAGYVAVVEEEFCEALGGVQTLHRGVHLARVSYIS